MSRHNPAPHRGFTLIELLVVISIIALLISILLPALSLAKESANVVDCVNDLRQISMTAVMYTQDQNDRQRMPWHLGFGVVPGVNVVSEFIYGGFRAPVQSPAYPGLDAFRVPIERRPFNKYIAPGLVSSGGTGGNMTVGTYICPSDKSDTTPLVGTTVPPDNETTYNSWQTNGNSYPINWYWLEGPPWNGSGYGTLPNYTAAGEQMLGKKIGGPASKFILFMESAMNSFMYNARPQGWPTPSPFSQQGMGWHKKWSTYSIGFMDGHAEHRFINTLYTNSEHYNSWAEPDTPRGF